VLIDIKVNDIPAKMLLETGMQTPHFDSTFVFSNLTDFNISHGINYAISTVYGRRQIKDAINTPFTFTYGNDTANFIKGRALVLDLKNYFGVSTDIMAPVTYLLKDNILFMDIKNGYIDVKIQRDSLAILTQGYTVHKLEGNTVEYFSILDTLNIYINGEVLKIGGKFTIDFGNRYSIILLENYLPKNFINTIPNIHIEDIHSFNDDKRARKIFSPDSISFANIKLPVYNKEIYVYSFGELSERPGIIGIDFLKDYKVIIDFKGKNLYLKPNETK
jgi:hypothetical protein